MLFRWIMIPVTGAILVLIAGCGSLNLTLSTMVDTAPSFGTKVEDQTFESDTRVTLRLPKATGGDGSLRYSLTPNVSGLTFRTYSGYNELSGKPTQVGVYKMTYRVRDSDDNSAESDDGVIVFTITVPDTVPSFGTKVEDQRFESDTRVTLRLPKATGGDGSLRYSLTPNVPGLTFRTYSGYNELSGKPTQVGVYKMTYRVRDSDDNSAESDDGVIAFTITVPDTVPSFGTKVEDQRFESDTRVTLRLPKATGGDGSLRYSLTPNVPGLTFRTYSGYNELSGKPTQVGVYKMTYRVRDSDDNSAESDDGVIAFTITVPDTAPSFGTKVEDQRFESDTRVTLRLPKATGGDGSLRYSLTPNVPGLTFRTYSGYNELSGKPTQVGVYKMTYRVRDSDDNSAESDDGVIVFTITVPDTVPSFGTKVEDQRFESDTRVTLRLPKATGGDGSLRYSLTPNVPGLTFRTYSGYNELSGKPTQVGVYKMTYRVRDSDDNSAESDDGVITFTITVPDTN